MSQVKCSASYNRKLKRYAVIQKRTKVKSITKNNCKNESFFLILPIRLYLPLKYY